MAFFKKDDLSAAIRNFQEALAYNEEVNDHQEIINSLKSLSDVHYTNQDYKQAIKYATRTGKVSNRIAKDIKSLRLQSAMIKGN